MTVMDRQTDTFRQRAGNN